jgi:hypothetical protein
MQVAKRLPAAGAAAGDGSVGEDDKQLRVGQQQQEQRAELEELAALLMAANEAVQAVQASNTEAAAAQVKRFLPQVSCAAPRTCLACLPARLSTQYSVDGQLTSHRQRSVAVVQMSAVWCLGGCSVLSVPLHGSSSRSNQLGKMPA